MLTITQAGPKPTDEQVAILDLAVADGNLQINALAGTGKTATLKMIDRKINRRKLPCVMFKNLGYNVLYLVFNKRNAKEAIDSNEFHSETLIKTLNGCGYWAWQRKLQTKLIMPPLNKPKITELFREHISEWSKEDQSAAWDEWPAVRQGIELSKALGYVPDSSSYVGNRLCDFDAVSAACDEPLSDFAKEVIDAILNRSISTALKGYIDFNDQIYMPTLFGGTFPRFPLVMVDEAQDLSPVNHAMVDKLAKTRLISVGDPFQSIYGFRGARTDGMLSLRERFAMHESDLSTSFRCAENIVKAAHWRVPKFKWVKPGGIVHEIDQPTLDSIQNNSAVICRNNAPLFRLALRLLTAKRSVRIHGTDMGPKIAGIMRKLGSEDMSRDALLDRITEWEAERLANGNKTASDIAECMRVFASYGPNLKSALAYMDHLFKQSGTIELLTGHKAKGLEWDRVYFLDQWLLGETDQELNLRYVIQTRAKQELYMINSREIV